MASSSDLKALDRAGAAPSPLVDPFARAITYLRVSVTDRCDFRCVYCMSEHMTLPPKADLFEPGGTRPAVQRLRCQGRAQAAPDRRRAAGAARNHDAGQIAVAPYREWRAGRADTHHQCLTAVALRLRTQGVRRRAHQRLARHARSRQVPRHHPLGRTRQGAGGRRCRAGRRLPGEDQRVALKGVNEDELADMSPGQTAAAWT